MRRARLGGDPRGGRSSWRSPSRRGAKPIRIAAPPGAGVCQRRCGAPTTTSPPGSWPTRNEAATGPPWWTRNAGSTIAAWRSGPAAARGGSPPLASAAATGWRCSSATGRPTWRPSSPPPASGPSPFPSTHASPRGRSASSWRIAGPASCSTRRRWQRWWSRPAAAWPSPRPCASPAATRPTPTSRPWTRRHLVRRWSPPLPTIR
jgi:hypothetical protein